MWDSVYKCLSLSLSLFLSLSILLLKKELSLYQKLGDWLDKREKVDKSDTKEVLSRKIQGKNLYHS